MTASTERHSATERSLPALIRLATRLLRLLAVGLASGAGPVVVALAALLWAERARPEQGEAFWILPTLLLCPPASALAGMLAAAVVDRRRRRASPVAVWVLTAATAFLPCVACVHAEFGMVTPWVAAPLLAGAVLGAVPAWTVARARRQPDRETS